MRNKKRIITMVLLFALMVSIAPLGGIKAEAAVETRNLHDERLRLLIEKRVREIIKEKYGLIKFVPTPAPNPRFIPRPRPIPILPPVEIEKIDDGRFIPKPEPILPPVVEDDPIEEPKEPVMSPIEPVEEEIIKPNKPIRIIIPIQPERPRFWDRLIPRPEPIKPPVCYK